MDTIEVKEVESTTVACDGNGPANGHPRVFLTLDKSGQVDCPYCSRRFVLKPGARSDEH